MTRPMGQVKGCSLLWTAADMVQIFERGKLPRSESGFRAAWSPGAGVVDQVLCCRCREYHHPDGVSVCMGFPTSPAPAVSSPSSMSNALDAGLFKPFPELWDFLTTSVFPDGASRLVGRLSVCFDAGVIKLSLTDDQTKQYASIAGRSVNDLFAEVDLRLGDGSLVWRPSSFTKSKRKG